MARRGIRKKIVNFHDSDGNQFLEDPEDQLTRHTAPKKKRMLSEESPRRSRMGYTQEIVNTVVVAARSFDEHEQQEEEAPRKEAKKIIRNICLCLSECIITHISVASLSVFFGFSVFFVGSVFFLHRKECCTRTRRPDDSTREGKRCSQRTWNNCLEVRNVTSFRLIRRHSGLKVKFISQRSAWAMLYAFQSTACPCITVNISPLCVSCFNARHRLILFFFLRSAAATTTARDISLHNNNKRARRWWGTGQKKKLIIASLKESWTL